MRLALCSWLWLHGWYGHLDNLDKLDTWARRGRLDCSFGDACRHRATTHHFFRGPFSAVSTPIFATKYLFCSIFRGLQNELAEFSKFGQKKSAKIENSVKFCKILNPRNSPRFCRICKILKNFCNFFCKFS